jgi:lysozyme family protein
MGITQADMPGVDIQTITQDQAIAYYAEHYWKTLYSQIDSQDVADKLFDMGVLFGVGTAVVMLQATLCSESAVCTVDGIFGPNTLAAINAADPFSLLKFYRANLATHVINIITAKPQEQVFMKGWLNRINS